MHGMTSQTQHIRGHYSMQVALLNCHCRLHWQCLARQAAHFARPRPSPMRARAVLLTMASFRDASWPSCAVGCALNRLTLVSYFSTCSCACLCAQDACVFAVNTPASFLRLLSADLRACGTRHCRAGINHFVFKTRARYINVWTSPETRRHQDRGQRRTASPMISMRS